MNIRRTARKLGKILFRLYQNVVIIDERLYLCLILEDLKKNRI